jgi:hypothetical protein
MLLWGPEPTLTFFSVDAVHEGGLK